MPFYFQTEKRLLPAPYDTNCTDYVKLWRENNGTGPLNDLVSIANGFDTISYICILQLETHLQRNL